MARHCSLETEQPSVEASPLRGTPPEADSQRAHEQNAACEDSVAEAARQGQIGVKTRCLRVCRQHVAVAKRHAQREVGEN